MNQRNGPRSQRITRGTSRGSQWPARGTAWPAAAAFLLLLAAAACSETGTPEPAYFNVLTVEGTPYERGYQHGKALAGEIRYFYTKFLSAGLMPWLNREQSTIAGVLVEYQKEEYADGRFAERVLLDSGLSLLEDTPEHYIEEMRGVADGSGVPFERIVILNTFLDTLFGMRALIFAIRNMEEPSLVSVGFEQRQGGRWVGVGMVNPFRPDPYVSITEVPPDARIRLTLEDPISILDLLVGGGEGEEEGGEGDGPGIDQGSIRIQLNRQVFLAGDPALEMAVPFLRERRLEVVLTPPEPMQPAMLQSLQIQAGDKDFTEDPPPLHSNVMRDQRTAFTTEGYAEKYGIPPDAFHEIRNLGDVDERLQPTSLSFALRGSATLDGRVLAAHHFTGLDNDTAHRSGAVIVHKPRDGNGRPEKPFITVGIAGVIWGSSGMSSEGLAYMYNLSDTHDNPVTQEFLENLLDSRLITRGTPIGFLMREMMQAADTASEGAAFLDGKKFTFGWNILLADAAGGLVAVERDTDIFERPDRGYYTYAPVSPFHPSPSHADLDPWGRPWASEGPDDLRMAMHYRANAEDFSLLGILRQQRYWTSYYFRSLRTFYLLGDEIARAYGELDLAEVERILRIPDLNDQRNSMNSAIYAPGELKMWYALGEVPATSAPYREVDFGALIGR